MIKLYEEGKLWHLALSAYQELANQYANNTFDLAKLARTERAMAKIYELIAKGDRNVPRYFRVCFKGLGFSSNLRDKQFIFEGSASERLSAFIDRMQQQYPSAQLLSGEDTDTVEGPFMQINTVSLYRDLYHPVFQRAKVPQSVREHVLAANPNRFTITSRRLPTGADVKQQVVRKTVFTTAEPFPTLLGKSEVIASEEISLSLLEAAIERTVRKTQELLVLEERASKTTEPSTSALLDAVSMSVDPTCETGIAQYQNLLPTEEHDLEDEGETAEEKTHNPLHTALEVALIDHAIVVKRCLSWLISSSDSQDIDRLRDVMQSK